MNGDSDGAPAMPADQGADEADPERSQPRGLIGRILGAFSTEVETPEPRPAAGQARPAPDRALLPGVANLRRMRVEDVAIPAVEIVAVPVDISREELVARFRESGLSRLPVYQGTLDHPLGLIHLKDFALTHGFNGGSGGRFSVKKLIRPLLYAPPSMPIGVLLQKMQTERVHMALVIDEYGGVDGLVTLEDLLEQVVGEIEDEHDTADPALWREEKPGVYLAQARTPLDEFEAETGLRLVNEEDEEEIDTLGGLVFMLIGRVPARGEIIRHPSGAEFEIVDADPRRIKRLRVRLPGAKAG
ncbi:MAG: hemolysin family protein [Rhodobacteraceae bacterium]|nr:hemolysin family protein [Paracoccaceae bacterium]